MTGSDVKHITRVLRLKKGDRIIIADGKGLEYEGVLMGKNKEGLLFSLSSPHYSLQESPLKIALYPALIRSRAFELMIQKATELGVFSITPIYTAHSLISLPRERWEGRRSRWQRIAQEAAKQSQRALIPILGEILSYEQALMAAQGTRGLIPTLLTQVPRHLFSVSPGEEVSLFIGPEGGFTPQEVEAACQAGFAAISLGPRVLRSETAGVAAVAILNYLFGDGGGGSGFREDKGGF